MPLTLSGNWSDQFMNSACLPQCCIVKNGLTATWTEPRAHAICCTSITVQCTEWSGQCIVQRIDIMLFPSAQINESWHCALMLEWITTDQYNASQWFTWVHNVSAMSNRVPQQHLFNINNDIIGPWVIMILLLNGNLVQESWMLFTEQ